MADQALEGVNAFGALQNQARQRMAYNALVNAYGPQAADPEAWGQAVTARTNELLQPGAVAAQTAETGYKQAATGNLTAETAEVAPNAAATRAEQGARTAGLTQQQKITALGQHVNKANAMLNADGSNAADVWNAVGPQLKDDLGIPDDQYDKAGAAFQQDPRGQLAKVVGMLPKQGVGMVNGQPTFTTENPLTGTPLPANTPASPFLKTAGAPQNYIDSRGKNHTLTFDEAGNAREGDRYIGQPPADWKPLRQEAINIQGFNSDTNRGRLTGVVPGDNAPPSGAPQPGQPPAEGSGKAPLPPNSLAARLTPGTPQFKQSLDDAKQAVTINDQVAQIEPIFRQALQTISPYTSGPGKLLKDLPASEQLKLNKALDTIQSAEFLTATNAQKNSKGQTGIGRFLASEVPMFKNAYGAISQDLDAKTLSQHLGLVEQFINRAASNATQGYKANYGANPYDVLGQAPYAPSMSTPDTGSSASGFTAEQIAREQQRRAAARAAEKK